eukprot:CAMPEP_0170492322 /NCGR_PEP_ID=MMETSP0208-20121228/12054_1 /TAXON_ID=197538 /ORGANISM="Strombidium inclinatum, Strain S3" /LENGTH=77 /DNA_ID=CAMNT_0010768043 /DNA_START=11 /DNA_END=244 /DNA_ORIENTATION=+
MKYISAIVLAMAHQALAATTKEADATTIDPNTIMFNQGKLWVLIIFMALALVFSVQVMNDNEPDTQKDSILYSKFLT